MCLVSALATMVNLSCTGYKVWSELEGNSLNSDQLADFGTKNGL